MHLRCYEVKPLGLQVVAAPARDYFLSSCAVSSYRGEMTSVRAQVVLVSSAITFHLPLLELQSSQPV